MDRLKTMVPFADRIDEVILELAQGGNWTVQFDEITGKVLGFYPRFSNDEALMARAKQYPLGVNQSKYLRYAGYRTSTANLVVAWALANKRQNFTDLGYKDQANSGLEPTHQMWHKQNNKWVGRKLCHGVHFDHPLINARTAEAYEELANITFLPDEMLENPMTITMKMSDFRAVGFTDWRVLALAFMTLERSGDWKIDTSVLKGSKTTAERWNASITFTPLAQWHRGVWSLEMRPGGHNQSVWEIDNGFYPTSSVRNGDNLHEFKPELGMNTHYLLVDPLTLEPFWSGETRQPATTRMKQHLLSPTSSKMEDKLHDYIRTAERPPLMLPTAQVHFSRIAEFEMRVIQAFESKGSEFMNIIRDVARNQKTITLDPELQEMPYRMRSEVLNTVLVTHGTVKPVDLSAYPAIKQVMDSVIQEFSQGKVLQSA